MNSSEDFQNNKLLSFALKIFFINIFVGTAISSFLAEHYFFREALFDLQALKYFFRLGDAGVPLAWLCALFIVLVIFYRKVNKGLTISKRGIWALPSILLLIAVIMELMNLSCSGFCLNGLMLYFATIAIFGYWAFYFILSLFNAKHLRLVLLAFVLTTLANIILLILLLIPIFRDVSFIKYQLNPSQQNLEKVASLCNKKYDALNSYPENCVFAVTSLLTTKDQIKYFCESLQESELRNRCYREVVGNALFVCQTTKEDCLKNTASLMEGVDICLYGKYADFEQQCRQILSK